MINRIKLFEFGGAYGLIVAALLVLSTPANAQQDSIKNIQWGADISKIAAAFQGLENTNLSITYIMRKSDTSESTIDSTTSVFQLDKGKLLGNIQGATLLCNENHSLTIDSEDSIIAISGADKGNMSLVFASLDSLLYQSGITGFERTETAAGSYWLTVSFYPESFYKRLEMVYDKQFLLQSVLVETADLDYGEDGLPPAAGAKRQMIVRYGPYEPGDFDKTVFMDEQYIKKDQKGKWVPVGRYSGWQVIDMNPGQQ